MITSRTAKVKHNDFNNNIKNNINNDYKPELFKIGMFLIKLYRSV